jgi:hypothetical protein
MISQSLDNSDLTQAWQYQNITFINTNRNIRETDRHADAV